MPSEKILELKKQQVEALKAKIDASCAGVVVSYQGINVADDTKLRKELREAGVDYAVVKNTLLHLAVEGTSLQGMDDVLEGTTALAVSNDDYVAAARILGKFAKANPYFELKTGYLDGELISKEKLVELSSLPSREVLLATVLNAFNAPIASFARAIQAIVDKSGEEVPAVEEKAEETAEAPAEEVKAEEAPAEAPAEEAAEAPAAEEAAE
ncbi:MAG: 50S ribosomal protein L10 [Ruminococcaceae bacterium]|nr:50S ribosomal protein L10 [Oscillospiraceae bacterium]